MRDDPITRGPVQGERKTWSREELRQALEALNDAAGNVYMELSGDPNLTMRGARKVEELLEPKRRALCALAGREYLPPKEQG